MARGQTVTVNLSNGTLNSLPDVVTGNPDYATAKGMLKDAGYKSVVKKCVELEEGDPNIDRVLSSDPSPGTPWSRTKKVTLGVGAASC